MDEKTIERQKVLVVEDGIAEILVYQQELGDLVDLPIETEEENWQFAREKSVENIKTCLEKTPYAVIFMDGQLQLELSNRICDGQVLVDRIHNGEYGSLNQNIEIQNISSAYEISGTRYDVRRMHLKDYSAKTYDKAIVYAKMKLKVE